MSGEPVGNLDDRKEEIEEMSIMGFPDEILLKIMTGLDLPDLFNLRVNKRLDRLQLAVKNKWKKIEASFSQDGYKLTVFSANGNHDVKSRDINELEKTLGRLSLNTSVEHIKIRPCDGPNEERGRFVAAFSKFEAEEFTVQTGNANDDDCRVSLQTLLALAENVGELYIWAHSSDVSAQDLCILRKTMLEGECKLRTFVMSMGEEVKTLFMEDCFGVSIEDEFEPRRTRIYHSANESIELLTRDVFYDDLRNVEGELETTVGRSCVMFDKVDDHSLPEDFLKVELNHLYVEE